MSRPHSAEVSRRAPRIARESPKPVTEQFREAKTSGSRHGARANTVDEHDGSQRTTSSERSVERDQIVAAAYRLVGGSPKPTSLRAILDVAGLSTRAFYRHFESKDQLIMSMYVNRTNELIDGCRAVADGTGSPIDKLDKWVKVMSQSIFEDSTTWAVLGSAEARATDGSRERYYEVKAKVRACLEAIIVEGVACGVFESRFPGQDAYAINAIAEAYNRGHVDGGETTSMIDACRATMDASKRILGLKAESNIL